jgi:hypothetical protein
MATIFFVLKQFVLSDIKFTLGILEDTFNMSIPKELSSSIICGGLRLILKGVIEDSFNEMPATGITTLGADLFKGSDEATSGQASGSGEASGSGQASGSGEASGSGQASGSGEASGSGQASGSGEAYGSSEGEASGTGEASSGENSDDDGDNENTGSDPSPHGDEINALIYNKDSALIGQPKKTLDGVRERLKRMKNSYIDHPVPASEGQIKFVDRKDKICQEELADREDEE